VRSLQAGCSRKKQAATETRAQKRHQAGPPQPLRFQLVFATKPPQPHSSTHFRLFVYPRISNPHNSQNAAPQHRGPAPRSRDLCPRCEARPHYAPCDPCTARESLSRSVGKVDDSAVGSRLCPWCCSADLAQCWPMGRLCQLPMALDTVLMHSGPSMRDTEGTACDPSFAGAPLPLPPRTLSMLCPFCLSQDKDAVSNAIKEAEEVCEGGAAGECAAAWDNVSVFGGGRDALTGADFFDASDLLNAHMPHHASKTHRWRRSAQPSPTRRPTT